MLKQGVGGGIEVGVGAQEGGQLRGYEDAGEEQVKMLVRNGFHGEARHREAAGLLAEWCRVWGTSILHAYPGLYPASG